LNKSKAKASQTFQHQWNYSATDQ